MAREALATGNKSNLNPTEAEIQQYVYQTTYDKAYTPALNSSGFGSGGAIRPGIMAVSAAEAITGANTGSTDSSPESPSHMTSDGHVNGAEKPSNIKVADDNLLKNIEIDAHQIKKEFLGAKAAIKLYYIYVDKDNGHVDV